jgi:hypothetical protein
VGLRGWQGKGTVQSASSVYGAAPEISAGSGPGIVNLVPAYAETSTPSARVVQAPHPPCRPIFARHRLDILAPTIYYLYIQIPRRYRNPINSVTCALQILQISTQHSEQKLVYDDEN